VAVGVALSNTIGLVGGDWQAARAELLSLSPKPAISSTEALAELKEVTKNGRHEESETVDDDSDLVELQSWGRRGQKQVWLAPFDLPFSTPRLRPSFVHLYPRHLDAASNVNDGVVGTF
jgi:hypothetical protein